MKVECAFCRIAPEEFVFEDEISAAFLDHRPLFPGHVLLIPKQHYETLVDLPAGLIGPFFRNVQMLSGAVETAMAAGGTFVAINNRVSQSIPHLHVHIVPRRKKDGLKGFFWPRHSYASPEQKEAARQAIRACLSKPES